MDCVDSDKLVEAAKLEFHQQQLQHVSEEQRQAEGQLGKCAACLASLTTSKSTNK